jgi:hypothetical protein
MKIKIRGIVAACFTLLSAAPTFAQFQVGFYAGAGKNTLKTSTVFATANTKYRGLVSYEYGITATLTLNEWMSLQSGMGYSSKSYQRYRTGFFRENYQNFNNGFVQIPLAVKFNFGGQKLRGFFSAGGFAEYWIVQRTNGSLYNLGDVFLATKTYPKGLMSDEGGFTNFDVAVPFNKATDKRLQYGYLAAVGLEYHPSGMYCLFAEARVSQSLSSLSKNYQISLMPRRNNNLSVNLGVRMTINTNQ